MPRKTNDSRKAQPRRITRTIGRVQVSSEQSGTSRTHTESIFRDNVPEVHATVKVSGGITKSIAPYEFARFDVGIELPCAPGEVDAVFVEASEWVSDRIKSELEKAGLA